MPKLNLGLLIYLALISLISFNGLTACVGFPTIGPFQAATATPAQKPAATAVAGKPVGVATVTPTQVTPSLEFSGTIEASSMVNLAPQITSRLEKLAVDVGSQVRAGDLIATLESTGYEIAVQQAQANLTSAQAKLETVVGGGRPEQVASAQAALTIAQTKQAQLQNPSPADVQAAQSAVDTAQANVTAAQAHLDQTMSGALPADLAAAQTAVDQATAGVTSAQARLDAVMNPFTQADWGAALAAVDTSRANLQAAQAKLAQTQSGALPADVAAQQAVVATAYNNLLRAEDALEQWKDGGITAVATGLTSNSQAEQNLATAQDAYNAAVARLEQLLAAPLPSDLQAAVSAVDAAQASFNAATAKVAQLKLGPLATDVAQAQDAFNSAQAGLTAAQARYEQLAAAPLPSELASAQSAADTANASLASSQARLDQLVNPTAYDIQIAASGVTQAQQTVALQANPYTAQDVKAAQAGVDQAQAAVDNAQYQLSQTTLVAPFDATVTAKLVSPGAIVGPGTPVVTLASNDLNIPVSFEESLVSVLTPGLGATITVAAYPGVKFPARVASIYPSADPRTHTFIMKIVPEDPTGRLKAGMFANIAVQGATRSGVIFVPASAVVQWNGRDTVFVVVDGRLRARASAWRRAEASLAWHWLLNSAWRAQASA